MKTTIEKQQQLSLLGCFDYVIRQCFIYYNAFVWPHPVKTNFPDPFWCPNMGTSPFPVFHSPHSLSLFLLTCLRTYRLALLLQDALENQNPNLWLHSQMLSLTELPCWQWTQKRVNHDRLPWEMVSALTLMSFKRKLDRHLSDLLWFAFLPGARELDLMAFQAPSNSLTL